MPQRSVPLLLSAIVLTLGVLPMPAQDGSPQPTAKPLIRIDAAANDLSAIVNLAVSSRGMLAAYLPQDKVVRLFSRDGKSLGRIGRHGEGPGEFRGIFSMGWRGDTLWITDPTLLRLTYFGPDGKLIRTVPYAASLHLANSGSTPTTYGVPSVRAVYSDESLLFLAHRPARPPPGTRPDAVGTQGWLLRANSDGSVRVVLGAQPPDACQVHGGTMVAVLPLCPSVLLAATPDAKQFIIVTSRIGSDGKGGFHVTSIGTTGDTLFSRDYSVPLTRVSAYSRDSIGGELERYPAGHRALVKVSDIPNYFPPATEVRMGPSGESWIGMRAGRATVREWRRLDPQGRPLPSIWLPRRASPMAIEARGAWAIVTGEDDLQSIVLYAVPR